MKLHLAFHRDVTPVEVEEAKADVTPAERAAAATALLASGAKRCPESARHTPPSRPHLAKASPVSDKEFPPLDAPMHGWGLHRAGKAPVTVGWSAWFPSPASGPAGPTSTAPAPAPAALDMRTVAFWTTTEVQAWILSIRVHPMSLSAVRLTGAQLLSLSEARLADSLFELSKGDAHKVLDAARTLRTTVKRLH